MTSYRKPAPRRAALESLPVVQMPYLTAGQAASLLGIHRQTLHDRIVRGEMVPAGRTVDGLYVFGRDYIEGMLGDDNQGRDEAGDAEPAQVEGTVS
jgi:hypothetical protein